jgi:hypothetical protein
MVSAAGAVHRIRVFSQPLAGDSPTAGPQRVQVAVGDAPQVTPRAGDCHATVGGVPGRYDCCRDGPTETLSDEQWREYGDGLVKMVDSLCSLLLGEAPLYNATKSVGLRVQVPLWSSAPRSQAGQRRGRDNQVGGEHRNALPAQLLGAGGDYLSFGALVARPLRGVLEVRRLGACGHREHLDRLGAVRGAVVELRDDRGLVDRQLAA